MQRYIRLDVCDYTGKALCNLYDSSQDISGQAHDVFVHTERNGFKELRFQLPSVLNDGEANYRLDYLISDYRIKLLVTDPLSDEMALELDWFLISESKVSHNALTKNYEIKASHISQLLNMKNLDLEFSDEEGNNVGTIGQIAEVILEGTGWHLGDVRKFYEEAKFGDTTKEKVRSFTSSAQTGAFKMMSDLCEMFDAKPVYHGYGTYVENGEEKHGRTVDIIPINPFSKDFDEGTIPPEVLEGNNILELYYDRNVKDISRTLNTDIITTRLSAYGSLGDRDGCSLINAEHAVLTFKKGSSSSLPAGEYCFIWNNGKYYFTTNVTTNSLKWSALDFSSRSYVYDGTHLFRVYKEPKGSYTTLNTTETYEKNYVPYLMDFTYYDKVGLLTDDMLRIVAEHQSTIGQKYQDSYEASYNLSQIKEELTRTASAGGFLMLDIASSNIVDGNLKLTLKKTTYPDGVVYRSDYEESKRNYFSWNVATGIKASGEAIAGRGAIVYIVHQGTPTKWERSYVKRIGGADGDYYSDTMANNYVLPNRVTRASVSNFPQTGNETTVYIAQDTQKMYAWNGEYVEVKPADFVYAFGDFDEPASITLWSSEDTWHNGDKVYLFSSDSIAGLFGPREDQVLSNRKAIEESTKTATEVHPLYFVVDGEPAPATDAISTYGWYYTNADNVFGFGQLYFCWKSNGDSGWREVYVDKSNDIPERTNPSALPDYGYLYSVKKMMLYTRGASAWEPVKGTVDKDKLTAYTASVIEGCINQEVLTKGLKEEYFYSANAVLQPGNYAFKNEYDNYWLFTTTKVIDKSQGDQLLYKYADKIIWQDNDENNIIKPVERAFNVLDFPSKDEFFNVIFTDGDYENQTFSTGTTYKISNNIYVHDNTPYQFSLPANSIVVCIDENNRVLAEYTSSPFTTPDDTTHVRLVCKSVPTASHYLRVQGYSNKLFSENKMYTLLTSSSRGDRLGLNYLMDKFIDLSHQTYEVYLPELRASQKAIKDADNYLRESLGDIFREGCWRKEDYVEGDEQKLYSDTLDNLKEVSHPQATYEVSFLDQYGSDPITEDGVETSWPDIDISYAAHLVDPDIDTNKWAYIDVLDKCYDQPWKTTLDINTRLSMIGQQSFTDVLTRIAEIANETKANQAIYKRAGALTSSGQMAAERLEGAIKTNKLYILGGTSNWYTDNKGNIIFEAADGQSAMMLSGRGWAISASRDVYGDWDWRYIATGKGLTADAIYTGYLSAERIEAGSITTDKLSSSVGQELDIGSNVALNLYATVDGTRPAGTLHTTDALIDIRAGNDTTPASITVASGGKIDIQAGAENTMDGEMNIGSTGTLNLNANSNMNINTNGKLTVSGGTIDIQSDGIFLINSENFKIQKNSTTGKYDVTIKGNITTTGGNIAGFTIGSASGRTYMYAGQTQSVTDNKNGVYLGTDGINIGGKFMFSNDGTTAKLKINASDLQIGNSTYEADRNAEIVETVKVYKTGTSNSTAPSVESGLDTSWTQNIVSVDSTNKYLWSRLRYKTYAGNYSYGTAVYEADLSSEISSTRPQYMRTNSTTAPSATSGNWLDYVPAPTKTAAGVETNPYVWVCTYIIFTNGTTSRINIHRDSGLESMSGAAITATNIASGLTSVPYVKSTGVTIKDNDLTVSATGNLTVAANASVNISNSDGNSAVILNKDGISVASGANIAVVAGGTVTIGSAGNSFVIGSTTGTGAHAYIRNGVESVSDTAHDGIYLGTDGIVLGKGKFKVTKAGALTSISGSIGGWTISDTTLTGNKTGLAKTTNNTDIAIWAGNATASSAPFRVTQAGALTATNADIKGSIKATSLYIGSTSSSDGTKLKLDSNGLVMSNSATAGDAVRTTAGIKVDTSGVVISSSTTSAASAVKTAAGIKVDTSGVVISSSTTSAATAVKSAAGIKVDSSGVVISSSTTDTSGAVKSAAGITVNADTGVVISSSGTAGTTSATKISTLTVSDGKVNISCTDVGNSSSTGIYISPTKIQAKSTGDVDFSAAKSLSLKAKSVALTALSSTNLSDYTLDHIGNDTGIYITPTKITAKASGDVDFSAAKSFKIAAGAITMSNISDYTPPDLSPYALKTGTYAIQTGIAIGSSGVDISGEKYVRIASGSQFQVAATGFGVNSTSTDYVLWAGGSSATATGSKFRVKADGTVYLTQLVAVGENGTETTVNLRTAGLWKLGVGATVKSVTVENDSCATMTFSNAVSGYTSVNFTSAASVDFDKNHIGIWNAGEKTIYLTNGKEGKVTIPDPDEWSSTYIGIIQDVPTQTVTALIGGKAFSGMVDASGAYNAGRSGATADISIQPTGTGSVGIMSSGSTWITGKTKTITAGYNSGGSASYSNGLIHVPYKVIMAGSQEVTTGSISMSDTAGSGLAYDAGAASVTVSDEGDWADGAKVLILSNGNQKTVYARGIDWSEYWVSDNRVSVTAIVAGRSYTKFFQKS